MKLAATIAMLLLAPPMAIAGEAQPRWLTDFAAAQAQARRAKRPILAVLHCGH